jgi:hypothetical protein
MEVNKRSEVDRTPECEWTMYSCRSKIRLTTVSRWAAHVTTMRRCKEVEIERIGTSHTTVSQQAEQVRVVIGQGDAEGRPKPKEDSLHRK